MGLDLVELVLEIEDEFQISLPDKDLECLATPNDLSTYIFDKFSKTDNGKCTSQVGFHVLRKLFMDNFGNKREELVPDAKLKILLGDNIRSKWKQLNRLLGNRLYGVLALKKEESTFIFYFSIFISLIYYFINREFLNSVVLVPFSYVFLFIILSKFFGKEIPKRYTKLSSLVKYMDGSTIPNIYDSQEKVLRKVIEISSAQLNIPIEEIKPDSRYIEDLGAG